MRAVLFDLDGTLVETGIDFPRMRREVLALAARHGAAVAGLGQPDALGIVATVAAQLPDASGFRAEVELLLDSIEMPASSTARAMAGAAHLLDRLARRSMPFAVVTRNSRAAALAALEVSGLNGRIASGVLLTRADVPRVKPDPVHLLMAAERLGTAPAETLMVGDHVMDVLGGRAAGMRTAALARSEEAAAGLKAVEPDVVVRHLRQLGRWISRSSL